MALVYETAALVSPHIGYLRRELARERCLAWAEELHKEVRKVYLICRIDERSSGQR